MVNLPIVISPAQARGIDEADDQRIASLPPRERDIERARKRFGRLSASEQTREFTFDRQAINKLADEQIAKGKWPFKE